MRKNNRIRWINFLDKLHVYSGLFLAGYLLILGISALNDQHHFLKPPEGGNEKLWSQEINMPAIEDNLEYKNAVKDSLGLFGNCPWWQDYKDDNGVHHFMITRPGKIYWVEVPVSGNLYKMKETRSGYLNVFMALHGLTGGGLKGPVFIKIWKFLAQIMNLLFLAILIISVYFWYSRSFVKNKGWIFSGAFVGFSILLLILIWLVG